MGHGDEFEREEEAPPRQPLVSHFLIQLPPTLSLGPMPMRVRSPRYWVGVARTHTGPDQAPETGRWATSPPPNARPLLCRPAFKYICCETTPQAEIPKNARARAPSAGTIPPSVPLLFPSPPPPLPRKNVLGEVVLAAPTFLPRSAALRAGSIGN